MNMHVVIRRMAKRNDDEGNVTEVAADTVYWINDAPDFLSGVKSAMVEHFTTYGRAGEVLGALVLSALNRSTQRVRIDRTYYTINGTGEHK